MKRLLTYYLDTASIDFRDKTAYIDTMRSITFNELRINSIKVANYLINNGVYKQPIAIFLDKSIDMLELFFGSLYSGNYYTAIDSDMPFDRVKKILTIFKPKLIITSDKYYNSIKSEFGDFNIVIKDDLMKSEYNEDIVRILQNKIIDDDPFTVFFTSGSTGIPKGVVISQRSVLRYIEWVVEKYSINEKTITCSQSPFYFAQCFIDIFATIMKGSTCHIINPKLYSKPFELLEYINKNKINFLYWVPSALTIVANSGALEQIDISCVKTIIFAGEVMPTKTLNAFRKKYCDIIYVNQYGATEITDVCTYYIVNRDFRDGESLPIGNQCENVEVLLIDDKNNVITDKDIVGELCVRGSFLSLGYYDNFEKTNISFIQNPSNPHFLDRIYKTGDLCKYNQYGEIEIIGRKDSQIKINGIRIELGEIETAASGIDGIKYSCCVFDKNKSMVYLVYEGDIDKNDLREKIKKILPRYMMPHKYIRIDNMPLNANGKIDRALLNKTYITSIGE